MAEATAECAAFDEMVVFPGCSRDPEYRSVTTMKPRARRCWMGLNDVAERQNHATAAGEPDSVSLRALTGWHEPAAGGRSGRGLWVSGFGAQGLGVWSLWAGGPRGFPRGLAAGLCRLARPGGCSSRRQAPCADHAAQIRAVPLSCAARYGGVPAPPIVLITDLVVNSGTSLLSRCRRLPLVITSFAMRAGCPASDCPLPAQSGRRSRQAGRSALRPFRTSKPHPPHAGTAPVVPAAHHHPHARPRRRHEGRAAQRRRRGRPPGARAPRLSAAGHGGSPGHVSDGRTRR